MSAEKREKLEGKARQGSFPAELADDDILAAQIKSVDMVWISDYDPSLDGVLTFAGDRGYAAGGYWSWYGSRSATSEE